MSTSRQNNKRQLPMLKGKRNKNNNSISIAKTLNDGNSYLGQQRVVLKLPGLSGIINSTITTGVAANSFTITNTTIPSFITRFGSTFDEYRILKCVAKVRAISIANGVTRWWFDEKSSSAPTAAEASERVGMTSTHNSADPLSQFQMSWTAKDLIDLQYTPIGTGSTPVFFKQYTDNANFGAPVAVTALYLIEFDLTIEFRGVKAV